MFIGVSSFLVLRNSFASSHSSKSLSTMSAAVKTLTTGAIKDNKVMVFSKSYCPYCAKTKATLDGMGIKYGLFELDVSMIGLGKCVMTNKFSYVYVIGESLLFKCVLTNKLFLRKTENARRRRSPRLSA